MCRALLMTLPVASTTIAWQPLQEVVAVLPEWMVALVPAVGGLPWQRAHSAVPGVPVVRLAFHDGLLSVPEVSFFGILEPWQKVVVQVAAATAVPAVNAVVVVFLMAVDAWAKV